jgi:hypothetical protein
LPVHTAVLRSVRDKADKIMDFEFILTNYPSPQCDTAMTGKLLSETHPEISATAFRRLVNVVESGFRDDWEFNQSVSGAPGWYLMSAARMNDGVVITSTNMTSFR